MIDPGKKREGADPLRHLRPGGFTPPTDAETRGPGRGPEALDTRNPRPGFPTEAAASQATPFSPIIVKRRSDRVALDGRRYAEVLRVEPEPSGTTNQPEAVPREDGTTPASATPPRGNALTSPC